MTQTYRNIPVSPETHEKAKEIAQANGRTLGGQIRFWTGICPHPEASVRTIDQTTIHYYGDAEHPAVDRAVLIRQCNVCGELIITPLEDGPYPTREE